MGVIIWLLMGAVAGWLAGNILKGGGFGLIGNIVIGIIGSVVGGYVGGTLLGISGASVTGFNLPSILTSAGGAILTMFVVGLIKR